MLLTTPTARLPRLSPTARLYLWTPLLLLALTLLPLKAFSDHQSQLAAARFLAAQAATNYAADAIHKRVKSLFSSTRTTLSVTRPDLERTFNNGLPFQRNPADPPDSYRWSDPASGRNFTFHFDAADVWTGYSTGWSTTSSPTPLPTPATRTLALIEPARSHLAGPRGALGLFASLALLLAYFFLPYWRALTAELLLALFALTLLAALLKPNGTVSFNARTFAVAGLFFSALFAALLRSALRKTLWLDPNLCPTCHYDLRASPHRCPECGTPITLPLHSSVIVQSP